MFRRAAEPVRAFLSDAYDETAEARALKKGFYNLDSKNTPLLYIRPRKLFWHYERGSRARLNSLPDQGRSARALVATRVVEPGIGSLPRRATLPLCDRRASDGLGAAQTHHSQLRPLASPPVHVS